MDSNINAPWLTPNTAPYLKFYHADGTRKNTSAIYTPALDRFILVDNCDFWAVFETAKIISSKIATQVFLLGKDVTDITNADCMCFTVKNKSKYVINGSYITSARQTPIMNVINGDDSVVNVDLPIEFQTGERHEYLMNLQSYTLFVLRCVHAINFTDAFVHVPSLETMLENYAPELIPDSISTSLNYTSAPGGMQAYIKKILYNANSIDEALCDIDGAWNQYSTFSDSTYKNVFNYFMGLGPVPQI